MNSIIYKNNALLPLVATLGLLNVATVNYSKLNLDYLTLSQKVETTSYIESENPSSSTIEIIDSSSRNTILNMPFRIIDAVSIQIGKKKNLESKLEVVFLNKESDNSTNYLTKASNSQNLSDDEDLKTISYTISSRSISENNRLTSKPIDVSQSLDTIAKIIPNKSIDKLEVKSDVSKVNTDLQKLSPLSYTVLIGDSLSKIAQKYGVSYVEIAKANNISTGSYDTIYVGRSLIIPSASISIALDQKAEIKTTQAKKSEVKTTEIKNLEPKKLVFPNIDLTKSKPQNLEKRVESKEMFTGTVKMKVPQGFIAKDYEHNWNLITQKSGEEIWELRKKLGVVGLGNLIGVKPGKCLAQKEERVETVKSKYSLIEEKAKIHSNVLPEVLAGLMSIESGGNSKCISETGALGSKQLTKHIYNPSRTWYDGEKKDAINPFNDPEAIERSADLLSNLLKKYNGNYHFALSAYNQGEDEVDKARARAKLDGVTNSYEIVSNYLNEEGRDFSRKVLSATKSVKKNMKASVELAMNN